MPTWVLTLLSRLAQWAERRAAKTPPRAYEPLPLPTLSEPEWSGAHRAEWERFLSTPTGRYLIERMAMVEYIQLLGAAKSGKADDVLRAGGWHAARTWLHSLSRASAPGNTADEDAGRPEQGEPGIREQLTP